MVSHGSAARGFPTQGYTPPTTEFLFFFMNCSLACVLVGLNLKCSYAKSTEFSTSLESPLHVVLVDRKIVHRSKWICFCSQQKPGEAIDQTPALERQVFPLVPMIPPAATTRSIRTIHASWSSHVAWSLKSVFHGRKNCLSQED